MEIPYNYLEKTVDEQALADNFRLLAERGGQAMAVIKSEAYGHGLELGVRVFSGAGAETLAAGTVFESARIRDMGYAGRVVALLGPLVDEEFELVRDRDILPFVSRMDQLERLSALARPGSPVGVALKFDTGMCRLGFIPDDIPLLAERFKGLKGVVPVMVASHLAVADDPEQDGRTEEQIQRFARIRQGLAELLPFSPHALNRSGAERLEGCLANTAGILGHADARLDTVRPGIGLYGANPFAGTSRQALGDGLRQAMSISAPVLHVHDLPRGGRVSYGGTFVADRDMRIAVIGVGYADGYSRGLSSRGHMLLNGHRVPILGRVCMQMAMVDVSGLEQVEPGDRAFLLGGGDNGVTAEELSGWWGTIPYEVFCLLGLNPSA